MRGPTDPAVVMVYYVDEQAASLSDLSDSWKGRKLPGKRREERRKGIPRNRDDLRFASRHGALLR